MPRLREPVARTTWGAWPAEEVRGRGGEDEGDGRRTGAYMPGKPPRPRIASIWRIIFFPPPPLNIFIIFCIC